MSAEHRGTPSADAAPAGARAEGEGRYLHPAGDEVAATPGARAGTPPPAAGPTARPIGATAGDAGQPAAVRVGLLGEVAVRRDRELAALSGTRARLLVAALAAHPGRSRSAQALIDDVWGEQPPRAPMNALHTQVSRLRSALPDGVLEIGPAGYRLVLGEDQVDLTLARRLERRARELHAAGDDSGCLALIAQARSLWRGDPGADLPPGAVAEEVAELAATRWHALDELELASREAAADLGVAAAIARRIAADRPLDEPVHGTLMRLLAADGRANEALEVFATLRERLADELGADPGQALVALHTAILRGEPMTVRGAARPAPVVSAPPDPAPLTAIGLRSAPNPLLGREHDLDALQERLHSSRVTTILGPGGTGKTRIANEVGLRAAGGFPVVLVELASVRADAADADAARGEVEAAISATLGVSEYVKETANLRPGARIDARRRLFDAVAARPMLLILDNCEHLIGAAAAVIADLVGICDRLTVLTTSRAPLEITAETVYPLPPLAVDAHGSPATELFVTRARAVRPSARLDPEVVARLCRTLDGLPLAIELAAARTRTMSVAEIESRLDHRFALLRSGDRNSPARHRTLHAVIDWSWNLLDEPQRIALRRLSRFPGGFTLAAAESVLAADLADPIGAVDGLVSQSLLTVLDDEDGGTRYRMLETVREFGEEQLSAAAETDVAMLRMTRWAREFAVDALRRYSDTDQVEVVLSVGAELDNLVSVLRYAVEHDDLEAAYQVFPILGALWMMRGHHMEVIAWSGRLTDLAPPLPADSITADLHALGLIMMATHQMFQDPSPRVLARLRIRTRRLLSSGVPMQPLSRFGSELMCCRPTIGQIGRKIVEGTRHRDPAVRAAALHLRANIRENAGDVRLSLRDTELAMACSPFDNVWNTAMLSQHLGQLAAQGARYPEAAAHYRRAVENLYKLRAHDEAVEIRSYLAIALVGAGDLAQARRELEIAAGYVDDGMDPDAPVLRPNHRRAAVQTGWAELAIAEGDVDTGLARYRRVLEMYAWPIPVTPTGPGDVLTAAGVLDSHILYDRLDAVPGLARQLATETNSRFTQFPDLPQIGAVSNAVGSYLLAVGRDPARGRELLALAPRVAGRQDSPMMRYERHLARHPAVASGELMAEPRRRAARLGRGSAANRILAIMRELAEDTEL
ncbi:AfsR/SARP family transcriptional regulator [Nocardia sp. alder85J]|uniref:AfsR/SARP family transcriptional regulator n=1 Tax=Nocardia sp. alder85J TaxID=2862949 RepID=UPI001CD7395C|nr:BTAD domain-containing putative transcriptional regulator [Nocardia sp. alder85J]MCX4099292.1 BTAD domain-containing putative transcriptional regulator [Nocardia sp. alder85J]